MFVTSHRQHVSPLFIDRVHETGTARALARLTTGPANEDGGGTTLTAIRLAFGKH